MFWSKLQIWKYILSTKFDYIFCLWPFTWSFSFICILIKLCYNHIWIQRCLWENQLFKENYFLKKYKHLSNKNVINLVLDTTDISNQKKTCSNPNSHGGSRENSMRKRLKQKQADQNIGFRTKLPLIPELEK